MNENHDEKGRFTTGDRVQLTDKDYVKARLSLKKSIKGTVLSTDEWKKDPALAKGSIKVEWEDGGRSFWQPNQIMKIATIQKTPPKSSFKSPQMSDVPAGRGVRYAVGDSEDIKRNPPKKLKTSKRKDNGGLNLWNKMLDASETPDTKIGSGNPLSKTIKWNKSKRKLDEEM